MADSGKATTPFDDAASSASADRPASSSAHESPLDFYRAARTSRESALPLFPPFGAASPATAGARSPNTLRGSAAVAAAAAGPSTVGGDPFQPTTSMADVAPAPTMYPHQWGAAALGGHHFGGVPFYPSMTVASADPRMMVGGAAAAAAAAAAAIGGVSVPATSGASGAYGWRYSADVRLAQSWMAFPEHSSYGAQYHHHDDRAPYSAPISPSFPGGIPHARSYQLVAQQPIPTSTGYAYMPQEYPGAAYYVPDAQMMAGYPPAMYQGYGGYSRYHRFPRNFQRQRRRRYRSETDADRVFSLEALRHVSVESQRTQLAAWLRDIRLHKYIPLFASTTFDDLMAFTDAQWEQLNMTVGGKRKLRTELERLMGQQDAFSATGASASSSSAPSSAQSSFRSSTHSQPGRLGRPAAMSAPASPMTPRSVGDMSPEVPRVGTLPPHPASADPTPEPCGAEDDDDDEEEENKDGDDDDDDDDDEDAEDERSSPTSSENEFHDAVSETAAKAAATATATATATTTTATLATTTLTTMEPTAAANAAAEGTTQQAAAMVASADAAAAAKAVPADAAAASLARLSLGGGL